MKNSNHFSGVWGANLNLCISLNICIKVRKFNHIQCLAVWAWGCKCPITPMSMLLNHLPITTATVWSRFKFLYLNDHQSINIYISLDSMSCRYPQVLMYNKLLLPLNFIGPVDKWRHGFRGRGYQGFCDNSTRALALKSVTIGGGGVKNY